jgi:hypothetical protein
MFNFVGFKRKKYRKDLIDVETILQSSLKPVSPRPEFIKNLQKGLMDYTFSPSDSSEIDIKKVIIFGILGITSLFLVFSLWIRLIIVIISTLGMIQSSKQKR